GSCAEEGEGEQGKGGTPGATPLLSDSSVAGVLTGSAGNPLPEVMPHLAKRGGLPFPVSRSD
ncbi:MAG: hypothetical protein WHU94_16785, partial [Thermogemmata sp.]